MEYFDQIRKPAHHSDTGEAQRRLERLEAQVALAAELLCETVKALERDVQRVLRLQARIVEIERRDEERRAQSLEAPQ